MTTRFPFRSIAVIAPSGVVDPTRLANGCNWLRAQGVTVKVMPHVTDFPAEEKYLSSSIENRLFDLHQAWNDPQVEAIFCARGGSGAAQLLDGIDWRLLRRRFLPLAGYSDITALHWAMIKKQAGIPLAAPMVLKMPELLSENQQNLTSLLAACASGTASPQNWSTLGDVLKKGQAQAIPLCGNLTVAASLAGSEYFPDVTGRLLVLEDLNEAPYRIDRALTQLDQAGCFARAAGVIFGEFLDCGDSEELQILFRRVASRVNGPVLMNFPFGHGQKLYSVNQTRQVIVTAD